MIPLPSDPNSMLYPSSHQPIEQKTLQSDRSLYAKVNVWEASTCHPSVPLPVLEFF
ncbi:hypothetical protein EXN66_Car002662 [Channa argus]|uniref:Uncharacterized protein n=1 Tax=Channa argus TaxID=215402 RepID=A0A6G1P9K8_CHAAH|nr:hypothetical protein EXN66_Car002662 [Channa argus]